MRLFLLWVALSSLVTFGAMAVDKYRAAKGRWRIPESRLLTFALVGGSPGLVAGMLVFRHKVSKPMFRLAAGAIVVLHVGILVWFAFR